MRGVMARLRDAERGSGDLDARANRLAGTIEESLTATHVAAVDVLTKLVELAESMTGGDTPPSLRVMVTMLRKSRPMLLEGLAKVPPDQIVMFMTELRDDCQSIIDAEQNGVSDDRDRAEGDRARIDQSA